MSSLDSRCEQILNYLRDQSEDVNFHDIIEYFESQVDEEKMSRPTVNLHLHHLIGNGLLKKERKEGERGSPTSYKIINLPVKKFIFQPTFIIHKLMREITIPRSPSEPMRCQLIREIENQTDTPQRHIVISIYHEIQQDWSDLRPIIYEIRDGKRFNLYDRNKLPEFIANNPHYKTFKVQFYSVLYNAQKTQIIFEFDLKRKEKKWVHYPDINQPIQFGFILKFKDKKEHSATIYEINDLTCEEVVSQVPPQYNKKTNTIAWTINDAPPKIYEIRWDET